MIAVDPSNQALLQGVCGLTLLVPITAVFPHPGSLGTFPDTFPSIFPGIERAPFGQRVAFIYLVFGFVLNFFKLYYFFVYVRAEAAYYPLRRKLGPNLRKKTPGVFLGEGGTMTHVTVLTTVLLSSSMLAATAAAQTQSQSSQCTPLGQRLGVCQTIGVSASAAGGALDLLRKDYQIVPIEQTAASVLPSHLVIGPADLDDPQVIALLKRSYRVGKTVAIVGATEDQAGRFHRLLRLGEAANCRPAKGQAIISLYGLQRSRYRYPPQNSSYCLVNLDVQHPATDRRWLRERFGLIPPQLAAGAVTAVTAKLAATADPTEFLTGLASATHCSSKTTNSYGAIEMDPYIYTMRNFTDTGCSSCKDVGADYYLVQDNLSFAKYSSEVAGFNNLAGDLLDTTNNATLTAGSYNLEFADPATTTTYESSYSNSTSVTLSESIGFDADGPNVSAGASVTTSQEMTYNVPPTQILNQSTVSSATAEWEFLPQSLPVNTDFAANPTWTWFVPQDSYPNGGTGNGEIEFTQFAGLLESPGVNIGGGGLIQYCSVPFPFSAWTVDPPQLSSLAPASTSTSGGVFTITGQYLYPGSVASVLIGGNAVPLSTNVDLIDATTIEVTVPGGYAPGTYPVQVNTQFNGENRFSNTLSLTLTN